jgi:hypothetical protein
MRNAARTWIATLFLAVFGAIASRADLFVDARAGNDGNGSEASPFRTLTAAVKAAKPETTIRLAPGKYRSGEQFPLVLDKPGLRLVGSGAGDSIIGGQSQTGFSRVFSIAGVERCRLENLTISGASLAFAVPRDARGVVTIEKAQAELKNCVFSGNRLTASAQGPQPAIGLVYIDQDSRVSFEGCDFRNNRFLRPDGLPAAAICSSGEAALRDCRFTDSLGNTRALAVDSLGGKLTLENCLVRGNLGNALHVESGDASLAFCTVTGQKAFENGDRRAAGSALTAGSTARVGVENSVIADNASDGPYASPGGKGYAETGRPAGGLADAASGERLAAEILEMTGGARAKLVWQRRPSLFPGGGETRESTYSLVVFDTDERKERELVPGPVSCANPGITPDGSGVVYSDIENRTSYLVSWDGKTRRKLLSGDFFYAFGVWRDPKTGIDWLYAGDNFQPEKFMRVWGEKTEALGIGGKKEQAFHEWTQMSATAVKRYRLDNPGVGETVWDKSPVRTRFRLSADGTRAGGAFPWPKQGVANLSEGTWKLYGMGCMPDLAPDNSYRFYHLVGKHTALTMYDANGERTDSVDLPGEGHTWHPRWSNRVRFLTVTAPFLSWSVPEKNMGNSSWTYFCAFSEDFKSFRKTVQITDPRMKGEVADGNAVAWIAGADEGTVAPSTPAVAPATPTAKGAPAWPADRDNLVFRWRNGNMVRNPALAFDENGKPIEAYALEGRGHAIVGARYEMILRNASMHATHAGPFLARRIRENGAVSVQALVTPADPAREGAGFIMSFTADGSNILFAVAQERDRLSLRLEGAGGKPGWIDLGRLEGAAPFHLGIVAGGRGLAVYRNGEPLLGEKTAVDFSRWAAGSLVFGNGPDGRSNWPGRLEGIAIHAKGVAPADMRADATSLLADVAARPPAPQIRFRGRLLRKSDVSTDLGPYPKALALYEYAVDEVLAGSFDGKVISVYHWAVMERRLTPVTKRPLNETCTLTVEPLEAHPELESECQVNTLEADLIEEYYAIPD